MLVYAFQEITAVLKIEIIRMQFKINFFNELNTFQIIPVTNQNIIELLKDNLKFIAIKNSIALFQNSIYGNMINPLHLDFAIDFAQHNDGVTVFWNSNNCIRVLKRLKDGLIPWDSSTKERIFVCYTFSRQKKIFLDEFQQKVMQLNQALQWAFPKQLAYISNSSHGKDSVSIHFDFYCLTQVQSVNLFLNEINLACDEINNREQTLTTYKKILDEGKANFCETLKSKDTNDWPSLFTTAFAANRIDGSQFSNGDFSWIKAEADEYARKVTKIVTEYDKEKNQLRKCCNYVCDYFAYNNVMTNLKGSGQLPLPERKAILAEYFSNLLFDNTWKIRQEADNQIESTAKILLRAGSKQIL